MQPTDIANLRAGDRGLFATIWNMVNDGNTRIAVVDAYMGGGFAHRLRKILESLTQRFVQAGKNIQFDIFWIRETFGFEKPVADQSFGQGITVDNPQGLPKEFSDRIRHHHIEVRLVLGDDMESMMGGNKP